MSTPSPERIITEAIHRILRRDLDASIEPARHVVSKLADAGYSIVQVECDGSGTCPVSLHIHGCFSDDGNNCDNPKDHICDCGTCVAIEAARAERAAEGEKP